MADATSFRAATAALRGTTANRAAVTLAFGLALAGTVGGALNDSALSPWARHFFLVAVLLMVSSVATAAKAVRDGALADLFAGEPLAAALRGSQYSRALAWGLAAVSVVLPPAAILAAPDRGADGESTRFLLLGLAYLFASTLNLAKASRDGFDAEFFERGFGAAPAPAHFRALAAVAAGTPAFRALNTLATAGAFAAALLGVWASEDLARERKALFCVGLLFAVSCARKAAPGRRLAERSRRTLPPILASPNAPFFATRQAYAAFQVSKLVRDYADRAAPPPRAAYAALTWAGFGIALAGHGAAVALMPVTDAQRRFFALASLFVLSSVAALAKLVRDDQERADAEKRA